MCVPAAESWRVQNGLVWSLIVSRSVVSRCCLIKTWSFGREKIKRHRHTVTEERTFSRCTMTCFAHTHKHKHKHSICSYVSIIFCHIYKYALICGHKHSQWPLNAQCCNDLHIFRHLNCFSHFPVQWSSHIPQLSTVLYTFQDLGLKTEQSGPVWLI